MGLAAVSALGASRVMAGPFDTADFERLVPADKQLKASWVASLTARGEREVYRGAELDWIGLPVGGLCAGQLYLGGDGKLWHWDILNHTAGTGDAHYRAPRKPASPLEQGFALKVTVGGRTEVRALDRTGFSDVSFCGEYPIGQVDYRDPALPLTVSLRAFSPFVPLQTEDSSLPATILQFTLTNTGTAPAECELGGWLENAVCLHTGRAGDGVRVNRLRRGAALCLECSATEPPAGSARPGRRPIVFDDFEKPTYDGWTVTGTAFGPGPVERTRIHAYQGEVGGEGKRVVNTHASAPGNDVGARDNATGRLVSREFTIERRRINFWVGGGDHPGKTCVNLRVGDQVVRTATGHNANQMRQESWDVTDLAGQTARIEIVDDQQGGWGNIGVDQIVFSDELPEPPPLLQRPDYGTMTLALFAPTAGDSAVLSLPAGNVAEELMPAPPATGEATRPIGRKLVGALKRALTLAPGQSATVTFAVCWHFPNLALRDVAGSKGRHYAQRFASSAAVADYLAANLDRLVQQTRLWHDTWYDSTLPFWLLDRTLLNASILATSTSFRFADGRFWGWEGVGCCAGTCTHVWHYAHAAARLFPELERDLRERTDYGLAFSPDSGIVQFRGQGAGLAIDGQCGVILRTWREHQVSADDAFLKRVWPRAKRALECLISQPGGADGVLSGSQHNTLDTNWFGPVAWLSGLYLAALRAGEAMASDIGDSPFATRCRSLLETGRQRMVAQLYNGEYFINKPDPQHAEAINSGTGCEIDQVFGQSWAWQVGLGRVLPEKETRSALQALWRYNFAPDVGPYRATNKPGRWYAMAGEAGLLMCTFPRHDWSYKQAAGKGPEWAAGYFNECMNGFEYQVAGHLLWEGLVTEGLAVTRAVHDRYHPARRNPWNEVECGDHYARSMASYGVYLAACGFEYHGPRGHLGFAPRVSPEDFRAAFTAAEGWGTYSQRQTGSGLQAEVALKWGQLRLRTLAFAPKGTPTKVTVTVAGRAVPATLKVADGRAEVALAAEVSLRAGESLQVTLA